MASVSHSDVTFSLPVILSIVPKGSINPRQRKKIYDYVVTQIGAYQSHVHTIEDTQFFNVIGISKDSKEIILLDLSVSNGNDLEKFFEYSKKSTKDEQNGLSYSLSKYFQNQEMQLKCEFTSRTKIKFSVVMTDKDKRKVTTELEKKFGKKDTSVTKQEKSTMSAANVPTAKTTGSTTYKTHTVESLTQQFENRSTEQMSVTLGESEQDCRVRMSFFIDVPEEEINFVRIVSPSVPELNRNMMHQRRNIYSIDTELPISYDHQASYWYEIHFTKSIFYFFRHTKEAISGYYRIGDKTVHRDVLESVYSHLQNIMFDISDWYTEIELCMQIEDVCTHICYHSTSASEIIRLLLQSGITRSSKYLTRFAFILVSVCSTCTISVPNVIDATIAHEVLDVLLCKRLSDFPYSCSYYMPTICKQLFKKSYGKDFCAVVFIDRCWTFLSAELTLQTAKECISSQDRIVNEGTDCEQVATALCRLLYLEHVKTRNQGCLHIVEWLLRHLPFELSLTNYGILIKLANDELPSEMVEVAHTTMRASIKSQILSSANKAVRDKKVVTLLQLATLVGSFQLNADSSIRKTFEDGILGCFAWYSLKETEMQEDVKDFLKMSTCFVDLNSQLKLLQSISESRNVAVRRLFIVLSDNELLKDAYHHLNVEAYKSWLLNEVKTHDIRNEDKLRFSFQKFCEILLIPVVFERSEIRQALECVITESLKQYTLNELLQHIKAIEDLCDNEPIVSSLYKEQVKGHLGQRGRTPGELLKFFSTKGSLTINTRTKSEIVLAIIELFFREPEKRDMFDCFISQIQHVAFWEMMSCCTGTHTQHVKDNDTYKHVMECIKKVSLLISTDEVDVSFMSQIHMQEDKTKRLLQLGGLQRKDIEAICVNLEKNHKQITEYLKTVLSVLTAVQDRSADSTLSGCIAAIEQVSDIQRRVNKGNISVKECKTCDWLWGDLAALPNVCVALLPVITSDMFWNIAQKSLKIALRSGTSLDGLIFIRYLFDCETFDDDVQGMIDTEHLIICLKFLHADGLRMFKEKWKSLETDISIPMSTVMEMFEKATVPEELKIAASLLQRPVTDKVKNMLLQLWRKDEVIGTANAMTYVLEAFGYDISKDEELQLALQSFKELVKQNISEYTLQDVQSALQTVFDLANTFTEETVIIMTEIGKSTLLVEFLRDIAMEDVRNLIDAVEDISESHVQESTVSALIEVKRFLLPLLNPKHLDENGSRWIFQTLRNQTSTYGKNASNIPVKICDCMANLHNLKSLYNNVANRGQQTKDIIKSIITKGTYAFLLDAEHGAVHYDVSYKENKNMVTKHESTISDIRSRALLLLNTERHSSKSSFSQDDFRIFIESIDCCVEIQDILHELYSSGNIAYKTFNLKLQSAELRTTKDQLKRELDEWLIDMLVTREKYYFMNFFQGCQIHTICDYLENGNGAIQIGSMLKFIHPSMTAVKLSQTYRKELSKKGTMLEELGRSLHTMYTELSFYYRDMMCDDSTTKITDCVHRGKLLVAHLEEESDFTVRTVLALYRNTTRRLPEPNQLLFCSTDTSWNEIDLLLQRCKGSYNFYGSIPLYCVVNVELLQNEIQFRLVEALQKLDSNPDYLLAVVCRGSKDHPFVDQLHSSLVTIQPISDQSMETILHKQNPRVFAYTSEVAGLGKTTHICKRANMVDRCKVTLHVSGHVKKSTLIANLNGLNARDFHVLHIDIGTVDEPNKLDTLLFELIILKCVASGKSTFYMPTEYVCVEIASTISNTLRNKLPTITSFKREHLVWNNFSDFTASVEINSPVQVVCQYLNALDQGVLDCKEIRFTGHGSAKSLTVEHCRTLLRKHMDITSDISFSVVDIFLNVLADQLKKLSCSSFFRVSHISEMIGQSTVPTVRSNLAKAMIDVSMEFATRSVNACRSTQSSTLSSNITADSVTNDLTSNITADSVTNDLTTKIVNRVGGMIRWEESNHLIYIFHNQHIQTLSPMYRDKNKVPEHVRKLFESQMRSMHDFSSLKQVELQNMLQRIARTNPASLSEQSMKDLAKDYALTPDNLLKMVLIVMRIQSKVPVVIMGETGCGKTSLMRYLASICEVPFSVMNIHAGVSTETVVDSVMKENAKCRDNPRKQRWLFLDEINTSENIGLICDIICHHMCMGSMLSHNMIIMGACNPYKLRTLEAIHSAGLSTKVKTDELSRLVYRVLPLPEMMVDYVWDFGSLSDADEKKYIERMIEGVYGFRSEHHTLLRDLLSISQSFVRETESSSCVVSLRDVQRCKTLVPWFIDVLKNKTISEKIVENVHCDTEVRAIILALAHCYHSRFMDKTVRRKYRQSLLYGFEQNKCNYLTESILHDIIKEEQRDILNRMDLPPGTAKNSALQENIFVILVCILNKIPVFVVGKPGCSKSLAMQVIRSNLRGKDSKDKFFRSLPQLYCVSFQGSESSTSDGIIKVFEKANHYQESNNKDSVLSVVILDEIGLAEISRFNPLKVLHNLLEPEGMSRPNVAVVGISNWALDASKMNRAIYLSRPDMDEEELFETAVSISKSFTESVDVHQGLSWNKEQVSPSLDDINSELKAVAHSYTKYTQKLQFKHFHGLRDFYALVKFIARKFATHFKFLTPQKKSKIIMEGLQRNFGGLKTDNQVLFNNFKECFLNNDIVCSSVVELIDSNISDTIARHLMIITKGESVLGIVEKSLKESGREKKEIIFGSQFEEDLTDDYNYRILSKIILCMEQGIVLVLKDLENIYGSLYDMLNQNYTRIGMKNNCRVALGPYSNPFCHVADSFRCIVLVDENKLDYSDPPFLNRFEKQFLGYSDIIEECESHLVLELEKWIDHITIIDGKPFSKEDTLAFYNDEMIMSLVIHINRKVSNMHIDLFDMCKSELLWMIRPEVIVRLSNVDDAEIQKSSAAIRRQYFELPLHDGLGNLIQYQTSDANEDIWDQMTIVITNSNIHKMISEELSGWHCQSEKLGAFKSEKQLSVKLQQFWNNPETDILIVQCSALDDGRHIMLTKSLIEKYKMEHLEKKSDSCSKFIYLVVHVGCRDFSVSSHLGSSDLSSTPMSQINYLSGWKLVLLDSLERPRMSLPYYCSKTLLQIVESMMPMSKYLTEELFWAFTRIQYGPYGRDVESISNMIDRINASEPFLNILGETIWTHIQNVQTCEDDSEWFVSLACNLQVLNTSAYFVDALALHIRNIIKIPLAKIIYKLEQLGALDSYFVEDAHTIARRVFWCAQLKNDRIFSVSSIKDVTGPECYMCDAPDVCLKMPFSRNIFESIETTKDEFINEVVRSKAKCELEADDELPDEIMTEIILLQESCVLTKIPDVMDSHGSYESLLSDYTTDFCNLYSHTLSASLDRDTRIYYMKWAFAQKIDLDIEESIELFLFIHCAGWSHSSLFGSMLTLLELCTEVFSCGSSNILKLFGQVHLNKTTDEPVSSVSAQLHVPQDNIVQCLDTFKNDKKPPLVTCSELSNIESVCALQLHKHDDTHLGSENTNDAEYTEEIHNAEDYTTAAGNGSQPTILYDACRPGNEADHHQIENENIHSQESNTSPFQSNIKAKQTLKYELSKSDSYIETSKCSNDLFQDFVTFISTKLIPTSDNLGQFSGIEQWQVTVRNVLIVAAEVSTDSDTLHKLRLCNDIVTDLLIPHGLDPVFLQNIGNSLVEQTIDSNAMFSGLTDIFELLNDTEDAVHIQRTMCQFLVRCLSTDASSTAYCFLFKSIEERLLPEDDLHLLKAPLTFLLHQELEENEEIMCDIISAKNGSDDKVNETNSKLLCALDSCLRNMSEQGRGDGPFVLLIVDLLQEIFEMTIDDTDPYRLILTSGTVIQEGTFCLKYVTAIAYFKAMILNITDIISKEKEDCNLPVLTDVLAVYAGLESKPIYDSMVRCFLKGLGRDTSLSTVQKYCRSLSMKCPFLKNIEWTEQYLSKSLEGNPLVLYVPSQMLFEGELCMVAEQSTDSFKNNMQTLMDLSIKESSSGSMLVFALAMSEFYLPRYRKMLDDTDKSHAGIFMEMFQKHPRSFEQITLMECLLGKRDFKTGHFMHGEETTFQQYMINTVLVSSYVASLSLFNAASSDNLPFLTSCLVKPLGLKNRYLPGFPENSSANTSQEDHILVQDDTSFAVCETCDRRLAFPVSHTKLYCVVCKRETDKCQKVVRGHTTNPHCAMPEAGYTFRSTMITTQLSVRQMSELSVNILQLLAKGNLLGSIALGISNGIDIETLMSDSLSEIDISHQLWEEVRQHWQLVRELLNLDDHGVGMILHSVLFRGKQLLFEDRNALTSCSHRNMWETKFNSIISNILIDRVETIDKSIQACSNLYKLPQQAVELVIREADDFNKTTKQTRLDTLPSLFRISTKPSKCDFVCQLWPLREMYPFLSVVLRHEKELCLTKHIYHIIQWHLASVVNTTYLMKRRDCLQMTVATYHDQLGDLRKRSLSKKRFSEFMTSWTILRKALENTDGFQTLPQIKSHTKMLDCLMLNDDSDIFQVLSRLININNDFVDLSLQLSFNCKNLQFLLRDKHIACFRSIRVTELKKEQIVDMEFDWNESLTQESNSGLSYGYGKQVYYDFHNTEKELAVALLGHKAYIRLNTLPKIVFIDELYRNFVAFIDDVCRSVHQESLPLDIVISFTKINTDTANMSLELINHLDMILTLLKKTKCDPQKPLADYVREHSSIIGQQFPIQYLPGPECRVKLCHVVSMHELLEEMSADRIIGGLGETYNIELEADMQDHFAKMPQTSIRKAEHVLCAMKRFIYRCIFMGEVDPEFEMIQFLSHESFWQVKVFSDGKLTIDGIEDHIKEVIPVDVHVYHVVAVVQQLNESIETQKQGELRMDRVITSWKTKADNTMTSKTTRNNIIITRQRKAVKKFRKS